LLLTFGFMSCLFVLYLSHRMGIDDSEGAPLLGIRPLGYAGWLAVEIVKCNIDVASRILNPGLPIQPQVIRVRSTQKTDLGRVVLANSITLTPGTVSMEIRGDEITVHALTSDAADFDASGEMNRRVTAVEGSQ
jgi:multicomponent Na+:H+ antiporter subunit E